MLNKKNIIIGLVVVIILGVAIFLLVQASKKTTNKNNQTPNAEENQAVNKISYEDRLELLQNLLAQKLSRPVDNIDVNIAKEDGNFIKGIVTVVGGDVNNPTTEMEGIFLARRVGEDWEIIWDGKEKYTCETVEKYEIPKDIASNCQP